MRLPRVLCVYERRRQVVIAARRDSSIPTRLAAVASGEVHPPAAEANSRNGRNCYVRSHRLPCEEQSASRGLSRARSSNRFETMANGGSLVNRVGLNEGVHFRISFLRTTIHQRLCTSGKITNFSRFSARASEANPQRIESPLRR